MSDERTAPFQRVHGGITGERIPWSLHLEAYAGYAKEYPGSARDQSAERMAERGGFGVTELDRYVPGWEKRVTVDWTRLLCRALRCEDCAPYRHHVRKVEP